MAHILRPSIHGIESIRASLSGPYSTSYCVELELRGEGDKDVQLDLWFPSREYAAAVCDAINAAPIFAIGPAKTEAA